MIGILTVTIALTLTSLFFVTRQGIAGFASGGAWAIFGAYCFGQSTAIWDIYYALGYFTMLGMTSTCFLAAFILEKKKDKSEFEEEQEKEDKRLEGKKLEDEETPRQRRRRRRAPKVKKDKYTGLRIK